MGKDSKGNRLRDRFPLAVSFADFFAAQRNRPAGGDGTGGTNSTGERRIRSTLGESPAAAGTRTGRGRFACGRPHFSARRNGGKTRRGTMSKHTSLAPFPQNRNTAKTPYRSVAPPLQIETVRFDLRRTFRRNLPAATKGSCAVFRRIRTRTPPHGQGAPPRWIPGGVYEGRGTGDEKRCKAENLPRSSHPINAVTSPTLRSWRARSMP